MHRRGQVEVRTNGNNCVEVADNLPDVVLVRDSKARDGETPTFGPAAWRAFIADFSEQP
ncbi:DUF397 domain-containing protein [Micromonospora trifolii]|uniref:DUF397 domain-containing protein n=1 Tax=Micromonospora trifolii TaxID=2911208 RepID=UPI003CE70F8B